MVEYLVLLLINMESEENQEEKIVPYELMEPIPKISLVEKAFKLIFQKSAKIVTKNVGKGGTSGIIYVPKRYAGQLVTIIIWHEKPIYKNGEVIIET